MELEDYLKQTYMTNPDAADEDELAEEDRPLLVCEECRNLVFVVRFALPVAFSLLLPSDA